MADYITVNNVTCSRCGGNTFSARLIPEGLYYCATVKDEYTDHRGDKQYIRCAHMQVYCKTCKKIYDQSKFGKHGDVYECKECGSVQWGLTDYNKKNDDLRDILKAYLGRK